MTCSHVTISFTRRMEYTNSACCECSCCISSIFHNYGFPWAGQWLGNAPSVCSMKQMLDVFCSEWSRGYQAAVICHCHHHRMLKCTGIMLANCAIWLYVRSVHSIYGMQVTFQALLVLHHPLERDFALLATIILHFTI